MKVGLIDVDGHNFPNIPLMKLSAWHKSRGHSVEWYKPLLSGHLDAVYCAKVFSFTPDYSFPISSEIIIKGGTGYCIKNENGIERMEKETQLLPDEIEHTYPDYELYGIKDRAYGFLSRGCPRGCDFCHVKSKANEGRKSHKVADLKEFWGGQREIEICDPNILACRDWRDLLQQLINSKAQVEFNQGLDARFLCNENIRYLAQIKLKSVHFALDRMKDCHIVLSGIKQFCDNVKGNPRNISVYVLVNFDTTFEEDLYRIYKLREIGVSPYVMIYDKEHCSAQYIRLQRWVNSRFIFWSTPKFEDYVHGVVK